MGAWYTIGLLAGLGTAIGVASVGLLLRSVPALVLAAVVSGVLGFVVFGWAEGIAGVVGAACGTLGAAPFHAGALRRGGTRFGTAALLVLVALVGAALAFIPAAGYVLALAVAVLGYRARSRAPDRHAGLRTLARD